MRNLEELKQQGRILLDEKRDEFVKQRLLSDEFFEMIQKNKKPMDLLMSYYQCASMEIETKFRVLNQEYSLEYDRNPIESIKTRIKSYESILKKIRRKDLPMSLESIEENIRDIAGVRVICSFPEDIYEIAESFLRQDDIILVEKKDYIKNPKPNGYKSYHMVVTIPVYLTDGPVETKVEIQIRTVAMDFWARLEHKIYYKTDFEAPDYLQRELKACADVVDMLDAKMFSLNQAILEWNRRDDGKQEEKEMEHL